MSRAPLIKICGVTRRRDAELAARLGADLVGLNFYRESPRFLEPERAAEIASAVRGRLRVVGVFVDAPRDEVEAIDRRVGLDLLQFHGDEGPEDLRPFAGRAIKAIRFDEPPRPADLDVYPDVWGFLFEPRREGLYGGSGRGWAYETIAGLHGTRPTLVAGGIRPGNARRAWVRSRAGGVDVCSGIEASPGIKDPAAMERLVAALRDPGSGA